MASDQTGIDHALTDQKNRVVYGNSIGAIRKFDWNTEPVPVPKELFKNHIETQVNNVKLCHLFVEHWSCREQKLSKKVGTSRNFMVNAANGALHRQATHLATKRREILLHNLQGLLQQHPTFSISPSPPPLHSMRVAVVALDGELPGRAFRDSKTLRGSRREHESAFRAAESTASRASRTSRGSRESRNVAEPTCRVLGDEDAMVQPGQYLVMWTCCATGKLLVHEASRNFCDSWNLICMQNSILVPLGDPTDTRLEVSQVQAEDEPESPEHNNGDGHLKRSCVLHLPLIAGCTLSVRLLDSISSNRSVHALSSWISNGFDKLPEEDTAVDEEPVVKKQSSLMDRLSNSVGGFVHKLSNGGSKSFAAFKDEEQSPKTLKPKEPFKESEKLRCARDLTNFEDVVVIRYSNDISGYTSGPRSARKKLWDYKHPTAPPDLVTGRTGLIITEVEKLSRASKAGLQPGMELLLLNGRLVRHLKFFDILNSLSYFDEPVDAVFSAPVKPNVTVTVRSKDMTSKKMPFQNQGMILEHLDRNHVHGEHLGNWFGFHPHDEIITINDEPYYHALGDSWAATKLLKQTWRVLQQTSGLVIKFGVYRGSGGDPRPGLENLFRNSSVFRYARGDLLPHLSSPPLLFRPDRCDFFHGVAWVSHCGLVLSIQSFTSGDPCIGIYLEDIHTLKSVEAVEAGQQTENLPVGADVYPVTPRSSEMEGVPLETHGMPNTPKKGSIIAAKDVELIGTECDIDEVDEYASGDDSCLLGKKPPSPPLLQVKHHKGEDICPESVIDIDCSSARSNSLYRLSLTFGTSEKEDPGEATDHSKQDSTTSLSMDSSSEFRLRLIGLTLASLKNAIALSKQIQFDSNTTPSESLTTSLQPGESGSDQGLKNYWRTYNRYMELYDPVREDKAAKHSKSVVPMQVAQALAYQSWSNSRIAFQALKREQVALKLLKHAPPITRTERWGTLATAINTGFFFMTLLFQPKCSMQPKPATCAAGNKNFWQRTFEPSMDLITATIFGLCLSMPIPLILLTCFRKTPVLEQMTPEEKQFRVKQWRFWQFIGWLFVAATNAFYIYWLTVFTNEFPGGVLAKVLSTSVLSLLHRFISAPCFRGGIFALILVLSKFGPCCDLTLVLCPQILVPGQLDSFDPGEVAYPIHTGFADSGLVDFDL